MKKEENKLDKIENANNLLKNPTRIERATLFWLCDKLHHLNISKLME